MVNYTAVGSVFIPLIVVLVTPFGMKGINAWHNKVVKKQNLKIEKADFNVKYNKLAIGAMIFLVVFMTLATALFPILYLCDIPDGPPLEAAIAVASVFGAFTIVCIVFLFAIKRWRIEVSGEKIKLVPLFGKSREYAWEDFIYVMRNDMYGSSVYRAYVKQQKNKAFSFASVMVGGQKLADEFHKRGLLSSGRPIHI